MGVGEILGQQDVKLVGVGGVVFCFFPKQEPTEKNNESRKY